MFARHLSKKINLPSKAMRIKYKKDNILLSSPRVKMQLKLFITVVITESYYTS